MFVLFWAVVSSCTFSNSASIQDKTCTNDADCSAQSICVSQVCIQTDCISSLDCLLEEYCDDRNRCVSGCVRDTDCLAGASCIDAECIEYGCRVAALDCLLGEQCVEGVCQQVEPSPCSPCTYLDWEHGLGIERECVVVSYDRTILCDWVSDEGCPGSMSCYPADGVGMVDEGVCISSYAFFRCDVDGDCPRGFHCAQDIYANDSDIHVCWGDCNLYLSEGWLE